MSLQENFLNDRWRKTPDNMAYGSDVERALFGSPTIGKEKNEEYMPFEQAVEFVKQHQPDPMKRSRMVKDLRTRIADLCTDATVPVKFFTAIGTPLDVYHGVDAFFQQGEHIVTVDISLREKESQKADVLLIASFDKAGNAVVSEGEMLGAASQIAAKFNEKLHRRAA